MRYLQIQVKGYRALADITLDLHPLTVMIGPNGCGKTSLLEVFHLLKEAALGRLAETITNLGGLDALLTRTSDVHARLEIAVRVSEASTRLIEPVTYRFVVEPRAIGYAVVMEGLEDSAFRSEKHIPPYLGPNKKELSEIHSLRDSESLPHPLASTLLLGPLDISPRAPIRLPQTLTPDVFAGRNGESLFPALYNLRETKAYQSIYSRIEEILGLAFPSFEQLKLRVVGAGQITLEWSERDLLVPLYPNQLSEGTLRFLWLITALLSPEPPPLILIDEPEVSLHPELLKILAALLQDASARTQILLATHSSDLIRWLQPDEVVVIDKAEGKSTFTWANDPSLNLTEWLKEYTLSDLWLMGNLGGRP